MALIDNRTAIVESNHSSSGGFSSFYVDIPRDVITKPPKALKLLDCTIIVPNAVLTRFVAYEVDAGNYHFYVENPMRTVQIEIILPQCLLTASPLALPATNLSGILPGLIATNADVATVLQGYINYWSTPAPPIGIGVTFVVSFVASATLGNQFLIRANNPYRMRFNTYDTFGHTIGFGKVDYNAQTFPYEIASIVYPPEYSTFTPNTDEGYIYVISDMTFGSITGALPATSQSDSRGILFAVPYTGAYFSESEITPFVGVEQCRLSQMYKSGGVFEELTLPSATNLTVHFWLQFPSGIPIDNSYSTHWSMRFTISFSEADVPILRIT